LRALSGAPALRILTLTSRLFDAHIGVLLSVPSFSRRLEYLAIEEAAFTHVSVRRIMSECTALLALIITRHRNAEYRPVDEDEWIDLQCQPPLTPQLRQDRRLARRASAEAAEAVAKAAAAAHASAGILRKALWSVTSFASATVRKLSSHGPAARPEPVRHLDLGLFLMAPLEFRRRLRILLLDGESVRPSQVDRSLEMVQICRRYPNLMHVSFTCNYVESWSEPPMADEDLSAAEVTPQPYAWMERETNGDMDDGADDASVSSARAVRRVSSSEPAREKLPSTALSLLSQSPFHFLRALKILIGLPLTAAELNPLNRFYDEDF
jgi:hypothetical protein